MRLWLWATGVLFVTLVGCTSVPPIQSKSVVLAPASGKSFEGRLEYSGPYSGTIALPQGPDGEAFTGRFIVVDRTAKQASTASISVPNPGGIIPATGVGVSSSAGRIDASGFWYATGDKGSTIQCELAMGIGGHGQGTCQHSNGQKYQLAM